VHLAWLGHPLLGDNLYGKPKSAKQRSNRLALHSFRLKFSQNWLEEEEQIKAFKAPLPAFFQEAISKNILPNFQEKIALERELSRAIKAFSA
jgi:23S rRNA pseudouridine1911/1915/1917 synthase